MTYTLIISNITTYNSYSLCVQHMMLCITPSVVPHINAIHLLLHPHHITLLSLRSHECAVLTTSLLATSFVSSHYIVCALQGLDLIYVDPVRRLLSAPLQSLGVRVLDLEQYAPLMSYLPWEAQRAVAQELLQSVLTSGTSLR
jgi:hypothetical protein